MGAGLDLQDLVSEGVAVIVATRDDELRPELSRAWGPSLSEDGACLTVCVEAAADSAMMSNLKAGAPGRRHRRAAGVPHDGPDQGPRCGCLSSNIGAARGGRRPHRALLSEGEAVGMPKAFARGLIGHDLMTVTIEVVEQTDETPGPDTGTPL